MAVVETLLGEAKGVFGKAYLLAGLLPAALLLFAVSWYLLGLGGIQERFLTAPAARAAEQESLKDSSATAAGVAVVAVWAGVALAVTGLVFFAARGPLLLVFQELPGDKLRQLSRRLREQQLRVLRRLIEEEKRLRWAHSALVWAKRNFEPYDYIEPWVRPPRLADAIRSSETARAELKACVPEFAATGRLPSPHQMQLIEDGLRGLRETTGSANNIEWKYEAQNWRIAVEDPVLTRLLEDIAADRFRAWAEVTGKIDNFPQEQWVRPTTLGNRFGAIEEYSVRRYHIDMHVFWSRIVGVLSDSQRKEVEDAELSVGVLLNLSAASALFSAFVLLNSLLRSWEAASAASWVFDWRSALALVSGVVLALVSYRGAVFAVGTLRDKVVRLFDLSHLRLTGALGFEIPQTFNKQLQLLSELNGFFMRSGAISDEWAMKQPSDSSKQGSSGQAVAGERKDVP